MQLAILLVVVCSVSGAADGVLAPNEALWRALEALSLVSIAPLASVFAQGLLGQRLRRGLSQTQLQRHLEMWQTAVTWLWAGSCLAAIHGAHWPHVVRSLDFAREWPLIDELLILAPLMGSLLLVWIAFHGTERMLQSMAGQDAAPNSLRQYLELRVRHHLGLTVLPALAVLGMQELAAKLEWTAGGEVQHAWWLWGGLIAAAVVALPVALKWLWQAQRVGDSPLKQRLLASCRRLGCPVRDIVVWRTGGTVANAAVAGFFPRLRTIFLSDALIAQLNDDEIDVVVRHEAAHLARHHLWQRLALLGLPVLVYVAALAQWPQAIGVLQSLLAHAGVAPALQTSLLVPLAALAYALVVVGWLARLHEHDADLAACCVPVCQEGPPPLARSEPLVDPLAVTQLRSALVKVLGGSDEYFRARWLHPSGRQRVSFLERIHEHPPLATRFRGRLLTLSCSLLLACLAALAAGCWPS